MSTSIDRDEVRRLLGQGAQLAEVLPESSYEKEHLPGAISLPLKHLDAGAARRLDPERPVIVYCYDAQCDLSPRAAAQLETLGFSNVYDYVAGKADWGSFGLPLDGRRDSATRIGAYARTAVPTCSPGNRVAEARDLAREAEKQSCLVVGRGGVLIGQLDGASLEGGGDVLVGTAMSTALRTVRPSFGLEDAVGRMRTEGLTSLPITHSDGVLVGVIEREDAEAALERSRGGSGSAVAAPGTPLSPGTKAPDFDLPSGPGERISLAGLRGRPVILAFYPGDWQPVCSDQMALYQEILPEFERLDATLLGVSVDSPWSHLAFAEDRNLHFPLIADFEPKGGLARAYGVYRAQDGTSERALYVIDGDGVVSWSFVSPVDVNPGADGILRALESLQREAA
jgi:peroxiredoxin/rhodanese-related sulfurtransferase/CBS domain-containing protein